MWKHITLKSAGVPWLRLLFVLSISLTSLTVRIDFVLAQKNRPQPARPDDSQNTKSSALTIELREAKIQSRSILNGIEGQVELQLKVTNRGSELYTLSQSDLSMTCNGQACEWNAAIQDPLLAEDIPMAPGDSREGWVAFSTSHPSAQEPVLSLSLKSATGEQLINVNQAVRGLAAMESIRIGPDDSIAVVELKRNMDQFTVWLLTAEFQRLKSLGLESVVLHLQPEVRVTPSNYSERRALDSWLISVKEGAENNRFNFGNQVASPVQFSTFFASNADSKSNSNVLRVSGINHSSSNGIFTSSRDEAIASAARPLYETISLTRALIDLTHPEAGIQQAVLETNIDRLDATQLSQLINDAMQRDATYQTLVAENLHRVAVQEGVGRLSELVRSSNSEISQAALRSLVRSVMPEASAVLKKLWKDSSQKPNAGTAIRQDIVSAILDARDHRHLELLAEFARDAVFQYAGDQSDPPSVSPDKQTGLRIRVVDSTDEKSMAVVAPYASLLQRVLAFLTEQGDNEFAEFARRELMNIADDGIQDVVVNSILANPTTGDERLLDAYVRQRLLSKVEGEQLSEEREKELSKKFGPRDVKRSTRVTDTLLNTIRRFPSTDYADRLLELSKSSALQSTIRSRVFQVAVRCATDDQLATMISQFDSLDRNAASYLMTQLATLDHPEWLKLAQKCLADDSAESSRNMALSSLRNHGSPEATRIVVEYIEELLPLVEAALLKRKDTQTNPHVIPSYRSLTYSLQQLAASTHPEARRVMNRCHRSASADISRLAFTYIKNFHRSSPNFAQSSQAYELRKEKKYSDAMDIYNQILDRDPFYSSGFVSRASLKLRDGDADDAISDLLQAEQLDPENAMIESLIAIAGIRRGEVESGLKRSEEILKSIPELATTLWRDACYNTACAYGRAFEITSSEKDRKQYLQRGMELLKACATCENGFDDLQHVLEDPDLNAFQAHDEWAEFLEIVKGNEENANNRRP